MITRLFQACGYVLGQNRREPCIGPYIVGDAPTEVAWAGPRRPPSSQTFTGDRQLRTTAT